MPKFLTKVTPASPLEHLAHRLRLPPDPLRGRRQDGLALPDNILCFHRRAASELNQPRRGRALHHRCVLILALRTAATVCVDERVVRLEAGEGLLVLPFQFHHYLAAEREELSWLFVTFEMADMSALQPLRFRPFPLTPALRSGATELLEAYLQEGRESDLPGLLLALLLARLRRQAPAPRRGRAAPESPGVVMRVNQLAQRGVAAAGIKEIARTLGISPSHLRARFRASCGVSLGRHLRRLRLEKACGLLRLTPNRVSEVAEQCGFNSIYHFSRAFRAAYGISAMEYRHADRGPRGGAG